MEQWSNGEIETAVCACVRESLNRRGSFGLVECAQVGYTQRESGWPNALLRAAINCREPRAQDFVPPHDLPKCLLECRYIEWTMQTNAGKKVISRTLRFHAIEEPEPFLRER